VLLTAAAAAVAAAGWVLVGMELASGCPLALLVSAVAVVAAAVAAAAAAVEAAACCATRARWVSAVKWLVLVP
jgi:hypothetical protein